MSNAKEFIINNWDKCVHFEQNDDGTLIGLPYPYIVPTIGSAFREMYYWDTYFTCLGLMTCGRADLVKNNVDNMLFLVNKYGFMPNGNRTFYLTHSQPPFLSMMVRLVYEYYKDPVWLKSAYELLEKEYYGYWQKRRMTPIGLNQYACGWKGTHFMEDHRDTYKKRTSLDTSNYPADEIVEDFGTDCESGWDCNPRAALWQHDCAYVDLNSNLYLYETNFAYFSDILENGKSEEWIERAEKRKTLMKKYMWDGECFRDYNFKTGKLSSVFSMASFYPLWAGLASKEEAASTVAKLPEIEFDHGVAACAPHNIEGTYQWDYPNCWAPLVCIGIMACKNYGFDDDAARIARKYVNAIDKNFEESGNLWEKYNAVDGSLLVSGEYDMPAMLGWTAGVYLYADKLLSEQK